MCPLHWGCARPSLDVWEMNFGPRCLDCLGHVGSSGSQARRSGHSLPAGVTLVLLPPAGAAARAAPVTGDEAWPGGAGRATSASGWAWTARAGPGRSMAQAWGASTRSPPPLAELPWSCPARVCPASGPAAAQRSTRGQQLRSLLLKAPLSVLEQGQLAAAMFSDQRPGLQARSAEACPGAQVPCSAVPESHYKGRIAAVCAPRAASCVSLACCSPLRSPVPAQHWGGLCSPVRLRRSGCRHVPVLHHGERRRRHGLRGTGHVLCAPRCCCRCCCRLLAGWPGS